MEQAFGYRGPRSTSGSRYPLDMNCCATDRPTLSHICGLLALSRFVGEASSCLDHTVLSHCPLAETKQCFRMLHRERQVQDENAGAFQGKLPDGNRAFGTPMVKHASNAPKQKGLCSTRKAFSSLTNNNSQANPVTELKGQQTTARRALGDITNATPQHRPLQQAQQKATVPGRGYCRSKVPGEHRTCNTSALAGG